ncbi:hypothetical protein H1164_03530 [Thermoactinomyces daqus]|uniref:Uncharacterized protein n=1 Tax=Thermoactinomyces daqus TaxID=1329516 RepID=A0A7W1X8K4_9BACL|nr:hypothetical protein [Thermoactinomyces daqus]MBA4541974.1 hypothetical protein [Thermoactinomyces daqus]
MWLKYLGHSGPNGEEKNEVREYKDEYAEYLLHSWPNHFVKASDDEIPQKARQNKKAEVKATK